MSEEPAYVPRHALEPPDGGEPLHPSSPGSPTGYAASVRPYVLTRGRTRTGAVIRLETLLSAHPYVAALASTQSREHHAVVQLCTRPRSLAEVAALLRVPVGVARVLVGDLVELSALVVHDDGRLANDPPSAALLLRVLEGLQRL